MGENNDFQRRTILTAVGSAVAMTDVVGASSGKNKSQPDDLHEHTVPFELKVINYKETDVSGEVSALNSESNEDPDVDFQLKSKLDKEEGGNVMTGMPLPPVGGEYNVEVSIDGGTTTNKCLAVGDAHSRDYEGLVVSIKESGVVIGKQQI